MNGDAAEVIAENLEFSGVNARPHPETDAVHGGADRLRAADRPGRAVEGRKRSVARPIDLPPSKVLKLVANDVVMAPDERPPFGIADLCSPSCRVDDVRKQHRREDPVRGGERFTCCPKGSTVVLEILGRAGQVVGLEASPERRRAEDLGPLGHGQHVVVGGVPVEERWVGEGRSELTAKDIRAALSLYRTACGLQIAVLVLIVFGLRA